MTTEDLASFHVRLGNAASLSKAWGIIQQMPEPLRSGRIKTTEEISWAATVVAMLPKFQTRVGDAALLPALKWAANVGLQMVPGAELESRAELQQVRQNVANWLENLPWPWRREMVKALNDWLREQLEAENGFEAVCWLIAGIGWRDPQTATTLKSFADRHDDERGDLALATLIDLHGEGAPRIPFSASAHARFQQRINRHVLYALYRLADPTSIDEIDKRFLSPDTAWPADENWEGFSIAGIIARIARRSPDQATSARAVEILRRLFRRYPEKLETPLFFGGKILPECDTPAAIHLLLDLLSIQRGTSAKERHGSYLALHRFDDCVTPRQRAGFEDHARREAVRAQLHEELCRPNTYTGRSATPEAHVKEAFCRLAFNLGEAATLQWLDEIIADDLNPYTRHTLLEEFACFRLSPLPEVVERWVTERFDATREDPGADSLTRLSATRVAWSAADFPAFERLLKPGFTFNGEVMWESAAAPADLAVFLSTTETERARVIARLLHALNERSDRMEVACVCHALHSLARAGKLDAAHFLALASAAAMGGQFEPFSLSLLVSATGEAPAGLLPEGWWEQVERWAAEESDWLSWRALQALAEQRLLARHPVLLQSRLGLRRDDGEWRWHGGQEQDWVGVLMAQLHLLHGRDFVAALADLIESAGFSGAASALAVITESARREDPATFPEVCVAALVRRIRQRHTQNNAEPFLFGTLAKLAPEAFARESWGKLSPAWMPEAREALAVAFCGLPALSAAAQEGATATLVALQGDTYFGVRRAAFRALGVVEPALLSVLLTSLSSAESPASRVLAAEALYWMPKHGRGGDWEKCRVGLFDDYVREVREAVEKARDSAEKRAWGEEHLDSLMALRDGNNRSVLRAWKHADALTRTGDDDAAQCLRGHLAAPSLAPNVRFLLNRTLKSLEKNWTEVRRQWPEPMLAVKGATESGEGSVHFPNAQCAVRYTIWREKDGGGEHFQSWGGIARLADGVFFDLLSGEGTLRLADGREGKIVPLKLQSDSVLTFTGINRWPD